jgi:regulator of RNase E activity RraA
VTLESPWPPGFAINEQPAGPDPELVEAFQGVPSTMVSDCLGRTISAIGLRAYHHDLSLAMCGPAVTVRVRPGDNLMLHKAMTLARPGEVIVVDGGGDLTTAVAGGLMRLSAIGRGLGGFVVDGAIRDIADWAAGELPVYARGHVPRGPSKDGPGEINVPIACAGLAVNPGDLMIGDADGVVAVPSDLLSEVLSGVRVKEREEREQRERPTARHDDGTFDRILREKGCSV